MEKKNSVGKTLPYNIEAEQSLLACFLYDRNLVTDYLTKVSSEDFYSPNNQTVFEAMEDVHKMGHIVDIASLLDKLTQKDKLNEAGGVSYITSLSTMLPSAANFNVYLEIVKRHSVMRKLIQSCTEIIESAYSSEDAIRTLAIAEKKIFDINQNNLKGGLSHISEGVHEAIDLIQSKADGRYKGLMTGFREFDKRTSGLQKGNLVILAATTGVGKSAMAINIMEHAAKNDKTVACFSLEMPAREIAQRLISSISGISMTDLNAGIPVKKETNKNFIKEEIIVDKWTKIWETGDLLQNKGIYIDDSSMNTPADIRSKCLRLKAKHGLDLIIVDYLQLMSLSGKKIENRQVEIAEISRNLKIIAKELDVPILALSQLSREAAKRNVNEGKEPVLSDLRESGAIEQDADMVIFIYKKSDIEQTNSDEPVDVELIVAKNRNGATFRIPLTWYGENVTFRDKGVKYETSKIDLPQEQEQDISQLPADMGFDELF
jgi:replicative DNA helicase